MIIFFEYGRLGNQLFQYCGLKHYFSKHKLIFIGCEDLQKNFDSVDARFIPRIKFHRFFSFGVFKRFVFFLVAVRILGRVTESKDSGDFKLLIQKGLIWNVYVPQNVFFQHLDFIKKIEVTPFLKPEITKLSSNWLRKFQIDPHSDSLIFIHIRRGDYLHWPSKEFPAILDIAWYKRAMQCMRERISNPVFVVMSDDYFYLNDMFQESDNLIISENNLEIDLGIMSLSRSGILSASSFAWWGAFYSRLRHKHQAIFVAPKYWAGHRAQRWMPKYFKTNWITYLE